MLHLQYHRHRLRYLSVPPPNTHRNHSKLDYRVRVQTIMLPVRSLPIHRSEASHLAFTGPPFHVSYSPLANGWIEPIRRKLQGRFLHITDMHPDPYYIPGTSEKSACHRRKPKKKPRSGEFGMPYRYVSSPHPFLYHYYLTNVSIHRILNVELMLMLKLTIWMHFWHNQVNVIRHSH